MLAYIGRDDGVTGQIPNSQQHFLRKDRSLLGRDGERVKLLPGVDLFQPRRGPLLGGVLETLIDKLEYSIVSPK